MPNITSIQSGHAVPHQKAAEPRAPTESGPNSSPPGGQPNTQEMAGTMQPESKTAPSMTEHSRLARETRQEIEVAIQDLQEAVSSLPGASREVNLLYKQEDQSYLIEIKNKETGAVLQTFPPENLLNLSRRSADLLGVLIDRHS
jgi:uncharacterized FlaG/YvyC family protein